MKFGIGKGLFNILNAKPVESEGATKYFSFCERNMLLDNQKEKADRAAREAKKVEASLAIKKPRLALEEAQKLKEEAQKLKEEVRATSKSSTRKSRSKSRSSTRKSSKKASKSESRTIQDKGSTQKKSTSTKRVKAKSAKSFVPSRSTQSKSILTKAEKNVTVIPKVAQYNVLEPRLETIELFKNIRDYQISSQKSDDQKSSVSNRLLMTPKTKRLGLSVSLCDDKMQIVPKNAANASTVNYTAVLQHQDGGNYQPIKGQCNINTQYFILSLILLFKSSKSKLSQRFVAGLKHKFLAFLNLLEYISNQIKLDINYLIFIFKSLVFILKNRSKLDMESIA